MIVTFISQCQKKALNRTRRILDAFADRIGDRTWQTLITEEGLLMVKKLLRQTVTKNTAVACHWRRGRNQSDLLWVVGSQEQFGNAGIVPVNITKKNLITDEKAMKPSDNYYANTRLQPLTEHLFAVGYIAEQLTLQLIPDKQELAEAAYIAGCLHDIGKVDPRFQAWVINPKKRDFAAEDGQHIDEKFTFDKHPRHNELSLLFYHLLDKLENKLVNAGNKRAIKHVIYWHHAKPFRKDKDYINLKDIYSKFYNNLIDKNWEEVIRSVHKCLNEISMIESVYRFSAESLLNKVIPESQQIDSDQIASLDQIRLPEYKTYSNQIESIAAYANDVQSNAIHNILRASLITADRLVSRELDAEALKKHIQNQTFNSIILQALEKESLLSEHIQQCLHYFHALDPGSERTKKQSDVAQQLQFVEDIGVLSGAAGCGKTKIALEWAKLKNAQQIIWVCPRVYICQGIFNELTSEYYLPNASIEINTGEYKYTNTWDNSTPENEYFSGDVVITTIDQILSNIITHTKVTGLINFLSAHVVFDEFHEYINIPAFNLLFAELIECKRQRGKQANTLLISATPNYYFLEKFLKISRNDIIKMPSFNQSLYQIELKECNEVIEDDTNPLYQPQAGRTFVISNTALTAQKSYLRNYQTENSVLLHSKYKRSDKRNWFNEVYEAFRETGSQKFDVLRSGPIIQASLNISCDYMISELTNAENTLQRLGRLDRFGKNQRPNILHVVVSQSIRQDRGNGASARFLSRMNMFAATRAWYQFLQAQLEDQPLPLTKIYDLYEQFYQSEQAQSAIQSDLLAAFKKSVDLIHKKIIDPINIVSKKITEKTKLKISKNSLRGDNRFVQMAVYDLSNSTQPIFKEQYAYDISEEGYIDNLTASIDEIEGYGDSNKNLLSHMAKKHHNIIENAKKPYKDFILLNEAREPAFPIYLSYTPNDLAKVGGENARHSEAIYYVVTEKQPIGAMSIKQLLNTKEQ